MITIPITVKESENNSCEVKVGIPKKTKTTTKQEEKTALVIRSKVVETFNNNYKENS